jgi:hypothetical protein
MYDDYFQPFAVLVVRYWCVNRLNEFSQCNALSLRGKGFSHAGYIFMVLNVHPEEMPKPLQGLVLGPPFPFVFSVGRRLSSPIISVREEDDYPSYNWQKHSYE